MLKYIIYALVFYIGCKIGYKIWWNSGNHVKPTFEDNFKMTLDNFKHFENENSEIKTMEDVKRASNEAGYMSSLKERFKTRES